MSPLLKICLIILSVQWFETSANPLFQGISFQRGFEINFKPLPRSPIAFIKEKWSPFGVFGKKYAIHKRSLDDMVPARPVRAPRPAAPVFEEVEEIEQIGTGPLFIVPKPPAAPVVVAKPPLPPPPVPKPESVSPPILSPPLPTPLPIIVNELPPLPDKPHLVPPISTNMVIIQPTKVVNSHVSSKSGLYTDITRVESVKEFIHAEKPVPPHPVPVKPPAPIPPVPPPVVEPELKPPIPPPPVEPVPPPPAPVPPPPAPVPPPVAEPVPPPPVLPPVPPPLPVPPKEPEHKPPHHILKQEENKEIHEGPKTEILLKDSTWVKGSKMALQFGTVFLTLMAQFFDSARATIDQMTNPPPKFQQ